MFVGVLIDGVRSLLVVFLLLPIIPSAPSSRSRNPEGMSREIYRLLKLHRLPGIWKMDIMYLLRCHGKGFARNIVAVSVLLEGL